MKTIPFKKARRSKSVIEPTRIVHFEFVQPGAETVCIAGTFNDWHPNATPMILTSAGLWVKELTLPPGIYEYCLIVDGHWRHDPHCPESVDNPFGGLNSLLRVSPSPGDEREPVKVC